MKSLSVLAAALMAGACARLEGSLPAPEAIAPSGVFRAGAARVDITPLPGVPLGGHSTEGRIARGHWLRLKARALYFEDARGERVALVAAELWSFPAGLADRVAELLGDAPAGCRLAREELLLSATHTHQSPANFSSSPIYNLFASPKPGFDAALFEFLAQRIARALTAACAAREPAQLAYDGASLVESVARNRSLAAFALGPARERAEIEAEAASLPALPSHPLYPPDAHRAVDARLRLLRVTSSAEPARTIGVAAFFAAHPTSMGHDAAVYSGDFFGAAAAHAERALGAYERHPVVAIFNGAEGDVSPAWTQQTRADVAQLGKLLGEEILGGASRAQPIASDVAASFRRFTLASASFRDEAGAEHDVDDEALSGASQLAGAEDGPTSWREHGWNEGVTGYAGGAQGNKQLSFDPPMIPLPLTRFLSGFARAPREVPLAIHRIGPLALVSLPGEFTTLAGRRIANRVGAALALAPRDVVPVGLAGEYLSCFTTEGEYAAQHYEGGSTLYGWGAERALEDALVALGTDQAPRRASAASFAYDAGVRAHFDLGDVARRGWRDDLTTLLDADPRQPPLACWEDIGTRAVASAASETQRPPRLVALAPSEDADDGADAALLMLSRGARASCWCAWWLSDTPAPVGPIRVQRIGGEVADVPRFHAAREPCAGGGSP